MILYINQHKFHFEMENLCRIFYPHEKIIRVDGKAEEKQEFFVETSLLLQEAGADISVRVKQKDKAFEKETFVPTEQRENWELQMATLLFQALSELTGYVPEWGVLTGVRPAKLMRRLLEEGASKEAAETYFQNQLLVSPAKTSLAMEVAQREKPIIARNSPKDYSLYISIPFCPTRCSYCSFVSHSMKQAQRLLQPYLLLLHKEIEHTGRMMRTLGLQLRTVYIGGGTPTTLSAEQLDALTECIETHFCLSGIEEFTVEAGRPDTITADKLDVLKKRGVGRISINPQTLNDSVLETIGRKHTAQQTLDAFYLARAHGFDNINMDLIAGLPGDTLESFGTTLKQVVSLDPESITVHTLALKRSSSIVMQEGYSYETEKDLTVDQLKLVTDTMREKQFLPYYMYRQSRTIGNLENVGYAKSGCECLYNIYMMDETHTVVACGAGGVTKLKEPGGTSIERIYDYKYPYEYIDRFDTMLERKQGILDFYHRIFANSPQ